jgi:hypothetical protein
MQEAATTRGRMSRCLGASAGQAGLAQPPALPSAAVPAQVRTSAHGVCRCTSESRAGEHQATAGKGRGQAQWGQLRKASREGQLTCRLVVPPSFVASARLCAWLCFLAPLRVSAGGSLPTNPAGSRRSVAVSARGQASSGKRGRQGSASREGCKVGAILSHAGLAKNEQ